MTSIRPGTVDRAADPAVQAELERLPKMPIVELRRRYQELFRAGPPKAFGPDLLRRSIAYRIQERAYGGLSREHQRLLDQLVKAAQAKPNGRLELPRRIKPGSELVRTWNRKTYRVVVIGGSSQRSVSTKVPPANLWRFQCSRPRRHSIQGQLVGRAASSRHSGLAS
jgi:hypothetical protein